MIALSILALAGTAAVTLLSHGLHTLAASRNREQSVLAADRVLAATSLLTRRDLDRRLGQRVVGEFQVEIQRPESLLYRVAVSERRVPHRPILVTVLYRRMR